MYFVRIIRRPCKKSQMCKLLMYQIPSIPMNRQSHSFHRKIVVACGCLYRPPAQMQAIMWLNDRPMHHAFMPQCDAYKSFPMFVHIDI